MLVLFLGSVIHELSRHYSREIYAVWYVWSLFFLVFLLLYHYAEGLCSDLPDALEKAHDCKALTDVIGRSTAEWIEGVYDYVTDVKSEVKLVAVFVYLALGPQFLAYCLGALSRSATTPLFVRQIRFLAVMSLVKFLAGLSGLLFAHVVAKFLLGKPVDLNDVIQSQIALLVAFGILSIEDTYFERLEFHLFAGLRVHVRLPALRALHDYFTRKTRISNPEPVGEIGRRWSVTIPVELSFDKGLRVNLRAPDFKKVKAAFWGRSLEAEPGPSDDRLEHETEWKLGFAGQSFHFRGELVDAIEKLRARTRLWLSDTREELLLSHPSRVAKRKFISRLKRRILGTERDRLLADHLLKASNIATIWIDPDGIIGADDVAHASLSKGRLAYCCQGGQHSILIDRLRAWKRNQSASAPNEIADNLKRIASEAGVPFTDHRIVISTVLILVDAAKYRAKRFFAEEFKEAQNVDPSLRCVDFINAKQIEVLDGFAKTIPIC